MNADCRPGGAHASSALPPAVACNGMLPPSNPGSISGWKLSTTSTVTPSIPLNSISVAVSLVASLSLRSHGLTTRCNDVE